MYLSSKVDIYEVVEFNVLAFSSVGKTASEYEGQLYYCGAYDTLSEIGRKSANLFAQGEEVEWRLIVQRTHACGSI